MTDALTARFYALTPERVLDSVAAIGAAPSGRFLILNSYENRVYQIELDDGTWVVGKYYRPGRWSEQQILEEHRFLAQLAAVEIPVAAPLSLGNGSTLAQIEGIRFALFPRIGGRLPQELTRDELRQVGRLIARVHNVGRTEDAPHRLRLTPQTYGWDNLRYLVDNQVVPDSVRAQFEAVATAFLERIAPLFSDIPMHRIHGDCHLGNLVRSQAGFTFLDFDDMVVGPAVQDVWMLAPSADAFGQADREALLEGYREFADFPAHWLRLVEPLRGLRFLHYAAWVARRIEDPAFARTFSHVGTETYWQRETNDLREQIARIDAAVT